MERVRENGMNPSLADRLCSEWWDPEWQNCRGMAGR